MSLVEAINSIISSFSSNDLFNSHTIINELITKPDYHLAYLRGYPENCTVNQYHGQIAKIIEPSSTCVKLLLSAGQKNRNVGTAQHNHVNHVADVSESIGNPD